MLSAKCKKPATCAGFLVLLGQLAYPTTSIPIDRAVLLMLLIAASTDAAFKSGIFCVAISRTCFLLAPPGVGH
jgi:hypothetical protein